MSRAPVWRDPEGACPEYPEGEVNEDGADEPSCEAHRFLGDGFVIHEMSNTLCRVHGPRGYIDSMGGREEAEALVRELDSWARDT
jgi:hypothetical protein